MMIEPRTGYDQNGTIYPRLVDEVPTVENGGVSDDLTSITWDYCTDPEGGCAQASCFDCVTSVQAIDDRTIKITFDAPKPYPYTAFAGAESPVLQKARFENCKGARGA